MDVTALSQSHPDTTAVQVIGVVWTRIPQPAGHHSQLYPHGRQGQGWLNTLEEDPDSDQEGIRSRGYIGEPGSNRFLYPLPLQPALQSGLDFDMSRRLTGQLAIRFVADVSSATLSFELVVEKDNEVVRRLARGEVRAGAITANSDHAFALDAAMLPEADRVPYEEENNLVLRVEIETPAASGVFSSSADAPVVLPETSVLNLPLVEFLETFDAALLSSLTRFSLVAETPTYKHVNPGNVAAFGFVLGNSGETRETLDWTLVGSNLGWLEVFPPASNVPGGGNATVMVSAHPPEDAVEGEASDALLIGQGRSDPNAQVFVRFVTQVVTSREVGDESEYAEELRGRAGEQEATPSVGGSAALVALALAVGSRLRRRARACGEANRR